MEWQVLILTLPTENATLRMRAWRTLKAAGAAVLRDGVYLLPDAHTSQRAFADIAAPVNEAGGKAIHTRLAEPDNQDFRSLFDRTADYLKLQQDLENLRHQLSAANALDQLRQVRKLRKLYQNLLAIDFFPGASAEQTLTALEEFERAANYLISPDEPQAANGDIPKLDAAHCQGKIWATRKRPWVDRLASAWLIARFIDPAATFLWIASPEHCPPDALGFDFDGASFTHVGELVTFEVLIASFGLTQPGLTKIAALVHYLDVGGIRPPEAAGVETLLAGLRDSISDDDTLLASAMAVFDGLLAGFAKNSPQ